MAVDSHKNFAYTSIVTAPSPATSGTSLTVADATVLPVPPFNATAWPVNTVALASNAEIVRVTAIATNTLTITRAQEGSTAQNIAAGYQLAAGVTAKSLTDIETSDATKLTKSGTNLLTVGTVTPSSPTTGDLWVDTN